MRGTVVAGVETCHGASLPDDGVNQKKCMFATQIRTSTKTTRILYFLYL